MLEPHLLPIRRELDDMADELIQVAGIPFEQTTEMQRQILATLAFGMIFCECQIRKLSPTENQTLAIICFMDVFRYADHQALVFVDELIAASSSNNPNDTHDAIIHHGIDGHLLWQERKLDQLKELVQRIFRFLQSYDDQQ